MFVDAQAFAAQGDLGDVCRTSVPECNTGLECNEGICTTPCGGPNQQCCQTSNPTKLCDVHIIEFQNLKCSNPTTPASGICQISSCGNDGGACCTNGTACIGSLVCSNNKCGAAIPPTRGATQSGQITIPAGSEGSETFTPDFMSIVIQGMFFILTLAVIFSVIR